MVGFSDKHELEALVQEGRLVTPLEAERKESLAGSDDDTRVKLFDVGRPVEKTPVSDSGTNYLVSAMKRKPPVSDKGKRVIRYLMHSRNPLVSYGGTRVIEIPDARLKTSSQLLWYKSYLIPDARLKTTSQLWWYKSYLIPDARLKTSSQLWWYKSY